MKCFFLERLVLLGNDGMLRRWGEGHAALRLLLLLYWRVQLLLYWRVQFIDNNIVLVHVGVRQPA